jgi:phosphatidate cytidylyltransferase
MASDLPRRVAIAAVAIPAAVGLARLGGWPLAALLSLLGVLGTHEVFQLARARGVRPLGPLGLGAAALLPLLALGGRISAPAGLAIWIIVVTAVAVWRRAPTEGPLAAIAVTLVAPLYTALLPSFALAIRHGVPVRDPWTATGLLFLPLAVVWVCDTVAMFVGGWVGGPKFAPTVSPNKTWSGTIGGVIGAIAASLAWGLLVLAPRGVSLSPLLLALFGAVLGVVGQVGDLAESLLKREAGVKDSGATFGAHGGVLDRLDSLYWAVPVAAILLDAWGVA